MTVEERFERIEHVTAVLAEERRKDREEYKQLWRDTQQRIDDLTVKIAETNAVVSRVAIDLGSRIEELAAESREQDRRLGERIDSLVSAIGEFLSKQNPR